MAKQRLFVNRSYLITHGLENAVNIRLTEFGKMAGFFILPLPDIQDLAETAKEIHHCIGIFAQVVPSPKANEICNRLNELSQTHGIPLSLFGNTEHSLGTNVLATQISDFLTCENCVSYAKVELKKLLPTKLKELSVFVSNYIIKKFINSIDCKFEAADEEAVDQDFDIFVVCESIAKGFVTRVLMRVNSQKIRNHVPSMANLEHQKIVDYIGEFTNQALGVINWNLQKMDIDATGGLPTALTQDGYTNLRSGFYTPSCITRDGNNILEIKYSYLVPFLKNTEFKKDFDKYLCIEESAEIEIY